MALAEKAKPLSSAWYKRLLVMALGVGIWHAPIPWDLRPEAWHLFALFLSAIVVVFMLLIRAAFLVAKGVIKSGLDKRIELALISRFSSSTFRLGYCIFATDTLLGPAIPSNTARSGILFPIVHALALDTGSHPEAASRRRSGSYLMLCGIASLTISSTAMAANPLGAALAGEFGVAMHFANWFLVASVPCILAFIVLPYVLHRVFPPERKQTPEAQQAAAQELAGMGKLRRQEWITLVVFIGLVLSWGLAGLLDLDLAIIALPGQAVIILTGVYRLSDLRAEGGEAFSVYAQGTRKL